MTAKFQGKRALVTGGNKRIGFVICQGLIAQGFEVILAARSRSVSGGDSLDKAKAAIEQLQSSALQDKSIVVNAIAPVG